MEQKVKIATNNYFFSYYETEFNKRAEKFELELKETLQGIDEVIFYIKTNFTEVPVFGKLDFDNLDSVDVYSYLKQHGSFYRTLHEQAYIIKLKELQQLLNRKLKFSNLLVVHKNRWFSKLEFTSLIKITFEIMTNHMISRGKKFKIINGLGYFQVEGRVTSTEQKVIDQYSTQENRRKLEAEGKTVKSYENPDGVDYVIYYTDSYFYRVKWFRRNMFEGFDLKIKFKIRTSNKSRKNCISKIYALIKSQPEIKLLYRQ